MPAVPLSSDCAEFYVLRIFPQLKKKILQQNKTRGQGGLQLEWGGAEEELRRRPSQLKGQRSGVCPRLFRRQPKCKRKHTQVIGKTEGEPCAFGLRGRLHGWKWQRQENVPVLAGPAAAGGPYTAASRRGDGHVGSRQGVLWTLQETWPGLPQGEQGAFRSSKAHKNRHHRELTRKEMLRICGPNRKPEVEGRLGS